MKILNVSKKTSTTNISISENKAAIKEKNMISPILKNNFLLKNEQSSSSIPLNKKKQSVNISQSQFFGRNDDSINSGYSNNNTSVIDEKKTISKSPENPKKREKK